MQKTHQHFFQIMPSKDLFGVGCSDRSPGPCGVSANICRDSKTYDIGRLSYHAYTQPGDNEHSPHDSDVPRLGRPHWAHPADGLIQYVRCRATQSSASCCSTRRCPWATWRVRPFPSVATRDLHIARMMQSMLPELSYGTRTR